MNFRIKIKVNKSASREVMEKVDRYLDDIADAIFARSQELVPVDESTLKKSGYVEHEYLRKTIGYAAPHAHWIEFGTGPHRPPVEPLQAWARRHGIKDWKDAGWAIANKIAAEGTEPQPFLRSAVDEVILKRKLPTL